MTDLITEARNANLEQMMEILKTQRDARLDLVVPASRISFRDGILQLSGVDPVQQFEELIPGGEKMLVSEFDPNGPYRPTEVFDEHISERFEIPRAYVRRMRAERPDLFDLNVNGWVKGRKPHMRRATPEEIAADPLPDGIHFNEDQHQWWMEDRPGTPADTRKFFLRLLRSEPEGVARALMSNRFAPFDNYDGMTALLMGLQQSGVDPDGIFFDRLDLTERGLYARVAVPEIEARAPKLCEGYRNPFVDGVERAGQLVRGREIDEWREIAKREGLDYGKDEGGEPIVFAGVGFSNSEVGNGSYSVWPEIIVQVCKNGLKMNVAKFTKRHAGTVLEEGVHWGHDTHVANLELVVKQTRDLITQFLSQDHLEELVAQVEEVADTSIGAMPTETIKLVGKKVGFTDGQVEGILNFFTRGGQMTAGGLANAITAYSQTVVNPDVAHALDDKAVDAMQLVPVLAR